MVSEQKKLLVLTALLVAGICTYAVMHMVRLPTLHLGQRIGIGVFLLGGIYGSFSMSRWALRRQTGVVTLLELVGAVALTTLGYLMFLPERGLSPLLASTLLALTILSNFLRVRIESGQGSDEQETPRRVV